MGFLGVPLVLLGVPLVNGGWIGVLVGLCGEFSIITRDRSTAEILSPQIVAILGHPQLTVFVGCPINSLLQSLHLIDNIIFLKYL